MGFIEVSKLLFQPIYVLKSTHTHNCQTKLFFLFVKSSFFQMERSGVVWSWYRDYSCIWFIFSKHPLSNPDLTVGQVNEDAADNLSELQRISGPWGGQMGTKGDPDNRWRLSGSSISHTGCLYILSLMQDAINEMWLVCDYLWSFFRHWIVNSTSKWEMAIWVYEVLRYVPQNSTSLIFQTCMLCFLCKFWTLVFWGVPGLCQGLLMVNPSHDTGCKNIGLTSNDFVR